MFNVKFCSSHEDGSQSTTAISCPHYSIYKRRDGSASIVTYKAMTDSDGVSREVAQEYSNQSSHTYQACYIENAQGKTVETVRQQSKGGL